MDKVALGKNGVFKAINTNKVKGLCHKCYSSGKELFIAYGRVLCEKCKDE